MLACGRDCLDIISVYAFVIFLARKRPFSAPPLFLSATHSPGSSIIFEGERCLLGSTRRLSVQHSGRMFISVWYAKKMGRRFIDNVRKAKKHPHHIMVGTKWTWWLTDSSGDRFVRSSYVILLFVMVSVVKWFVKLCENYPNGKLRFAIITMEIYRLFLSCLT